MSIARPIISRTLWSNGKHALHMKGISWIIPTWRIWSTSKMVCTIWKIRLSFPTHLFFIPPFKWTHNTTHLQLALNSKKFIQESLNSSDALIAQELVGYLLIPSVAAEKAFILYGPGRSGKSTFLKVIEQILGKSQISNVALQDLSQRFKASLLHGKLANIYADLPNKSIQDTGVLRRL